VAPEELAGEAREGYTSKAVAVGEPAVAGRTTRWEALL
jgi:hypothetical protein